MDVIEIVQAAADEIGLVVPSSVASPSDEVARRALRLVNKGGRLLARKRNAWSNGWLALNKEFTFETVADQEEYRLPDDYQAMVTGTVWDRASYYEARGPLSPQDWQLVRSGLIESAVLTPRFRLRRPTVASPAGRALWLDPVPGESGETLVLEYISNAWLRPVDGSPFGADDIRAIGADTDEFLLDDDLHQMDLLWRLKQAEGLSFAVELAEFEMEWKSRIAEDPGGRDVNMSGRRRVYYGANVPLTGFGGVGG